MSELNNTSEENPDPKKKSSGNKNKKSKGGLIGKISSAIKDDISKDILKIENTISARSPLKEYKDGTPFPGKIGKTVSQSSPAWPAEAKPKEGSPNVLFWILDDVGYGQISAYGGLVETPNIDRLANNGLRYTNMHTTALCSPTRSCILTGRNHHSNGIAAVTEMSTGYPGYNGRMPFENGMISEILLEEGYNTFCVGKWHLNPPMDGTPAGPYKRWPLGRGFERFYGFLNGETNQWYPDIIYDNHSVNQPRSPEEGYHLTEDLTDKAIQFIFDSHVNDPDKPFFMYYATGAAHAPHHVSKEWIDKYKGKFDMGWDKYREIVFKKQKELKLFAEDAVLSDHDPDVAEWDMLSADEKKLFARYMEIYAGFISHADDQFGSLISSLEKIGELDNTIIIVVSDNGASSEGGTAGAFNEMSAFNSLTEDFSEVFKKMDELGGPKSYNHYPWGWSWAGNTPFKRWKKEVYRGGCTDNMIIHWPKGISSKGELRSQYTHAIDIMPTLLELLNFKSPDQIKGVTQSPVEGVSFAHTLNDPDANSKHNTQYFEMFGCRAIDHDGWRAVCGWPGPNYAEGLKNGYKFGEEITPEILKDLDSSGWELFNIKDDPTESRNVAKENPEKLKELIDLWWSEAVKYKVLPLDGSTLLRFKEKRPSVKENKNEYTFYSGLSVVPIGNIPKVFNRPHNIIAEVEIPEGGAEGVILAQGGIAGGYTMFIKDKKLHYVYNYLGFEQFELISEEEIPEGKFTLKFRFLPTGIPKIKEGKGTPGNAHLYINDKLVSEQKFPYTVPFTFGIVGISCGYDFGEAVSDKYKAPFTFTGKIFDVKVEVYGELINDMLLEIKSVMSRQ